jgi:hypothetical protein
MDEKTKKELHELIGDMECPKGFQWYTSGLEVLCKARDIGLDEYLECMEVYPQKCPFSFSFGYSHLCQCPLRVYIARKLKK